MEKKSKKELAEIEKIKKKLIAIKAKSINPIHCINFLKVIVEENLTNPENSFNLKDFLSEGKYKHETTQQTIPYLISFVRYELIIHEDSKEEIHTELKHTLQKQYLIALPSIQQSIFHHESQLSSYFESCQSLADQGNSLFFIVDSTQSAKKAGALSYSKWIEPLEMTSPCMHFNLVRSNLESLEYIRCAIKAVAELPYKKQLEKGDLMYTSCMTTSGGGGGGVGGGGEWKKMLMSFNNVSNDMADAILASYPNLSSLFEAYSECSTEKEKNRLLENIVVRRGAGLTSTCRRIGPELSSRISTALLSLQPSHPLN